MYETCSRDRRVLGGAWRRLHACDRDRRWHGVAVTSALVSVADAARLLFGAATRSDQMRVVRLCQSGQLRALRDGRRWWIARAALDELSNAA